MPDPWKAEREVALPEARALIARAAPELAGCSVEPFGAGLDNTAYLADRRYVFRFPRRALAVAPMRTEIAVLPTLAPALPLRIPNPTFVGQGGPGYPWPFAGYAVLAGDVAAERALSDAARARAAPALGAFLAALHGAPVGPLRARGLPLDELARLDAETRLPQALARVDATVAGDEELGGAAFAARLRDRLRATAPFGRVDPADVVVHGDLDARHVLVDADGAPVGVLDWGDLHLGDRAVDLALAFTFLPPPPSPARARFRAAYDAASPGAVSDATWQAARFRGLGHTLAVLEWATAAGRGALAVEARRGLRNALA